MDIIAIIVVLAISVGFSLIVNDTSFWMGWTTALALVIFAQDLLGKERYLEFVSENWTPPYISTPIALLGLVFVGWRTYKKRNKE